jgi:hypothetical protein
LSLFSDSSKEVDDDDYEYKLSAGPLQSPFSDEHGLDTGRFYTGKPIATKTIFQIEELSDYEDFDQKLEVVLPSATEDAESEQDRPRFSSARNINPELLSSFQDMKSCSYSED